MSLGRWSGELSPVNPTVLLGVGDLFDGPELGLTVGLCSTMRLDIFAVAKLANLFLPLLGEPLDHE